MSQRWGAGGDSGIGELEAAGTRDSKWLIDRAKTFLQAGAHVRKRLLIHVTITHIKFLLYMSQQMIMIESEGITENVRRWRTDVISAITSNLPNDKIMQVPH